MPAMKKNTTTRHSQKMLKKSFSDCVKNYSVQKALICFIRVCSGIITLSASLHSYFEYDSFTEKERTQNKQLKDGNSIL